MTQVSTTKAAAALPESEPRRMASTSERVIAEDPSIQRDPRIRLPGPSAPLYRYQLLALDFGGSKQILKCRRVSVRPGSPLQLLRNGGHFCDAGRSRADAATNSQLIQCA